jgi:hypothetical protein
MSRRTEEILAWYFSLKENCPSAFIYICLHSNRTSPKHLGWGWGDAKMLFWFEYQQYSPTVGQKVQDLSTYAYHDIPVNSGHFRKCRGCCVVLRG